MIRTISLLPLASGAFSIMLGVLALVTATRRSRTLLLFATLCASTAAWCVGYFLSFNSAFRPDVSLSPIGSAAYVAFLVQGIGAAAAPTYWYLFAASYADLPKLTRGWRLAVAHLPLAYGLVAAGTNPLHHLFLRMSGDRLVYGPLAPVNQVTTFVLLGCGLFLIVRASWRRGGAHGRRQAVVIGAAATVPLAAGILWSLRYTLGLQLPVNPSPVTFPLLNAALAYELFRAGLADIVPYATSQAFNAISDAALALDSTGSVAAFNSSASHLLPGLVIGTRLPDVAPGLADALETDAAQPTAVGFDLALDDRIFWGRVRPMRDRRGLKMGSIVLLTDVTEMRMTQERLIEVARESRRVTA